MFTIRPILLEERHGQALYWNLGLEFEARQNYRLYDQADDVREQKPKLDDS